MKKKILIIGAGFAGLQAVNIIRSGLKRIVDFELAVVDKKETFDFLPMLPDIISGRVWPGNARLDLKEYFSSLGVDYIHDEVVALHLKEKYVVLASGRIIEFTFILLASGSETNFYNKADIKERFFRLDSASDALKLHLEIMKEPGRNILIVGAGYTGVEAASSVLQLLNKLNAKSRVYLIEISSNILSVLPEWMKNYIEDMMRKQNARILTGVSLENFENSKALLSDGTIIENALVVWVAGVRAPDFISKAGINRDRQSRVIVDGYLCFAEGAYAAGDCAAFNYRGKVLRMAVQFSIFEARTAANNILNEIRGRERRFYHPIDLGYIVPLSNGIGCGQVLNIRVKGRIAWFMHWIMCIYRTPKAARRIKLIKNLIYGKEE
ncbi:MAG: hypothetical protein C4533_06300 [Candidatus Omnitrophota bacterium]|jgi:NADH dehydrogenase|nr:MAG: hypothetical protein C4533_06300 [Candidatus Omnitrophota bacterium]